MNIKRWIVTAVDFDADGCCDGKAKVLAVCKTEDEAKNFILADMREYVDESELEPGSLTLDEDRMLVCTVDALNGCTWNCEEVEIDVSC